MSNVNGNMDLNITNGKIFGSGYDLYIFLDYFVRKDLLNNRVYFRSLDMIHERKTGGKRNHFIYIKDLKDLINRYHSEG